MLTRLLLLLLGLLLGLLGLLLSWIDGIRIVLPCLGIVVYRRMMLGVGHLRPKTSTYTVQYCSQQRFGLYNVESSPNPLVLCHLRHLSRLPACPCVDLTV